MIEMKKEKILNHKNIMPLNPKSPVKISIKKKFNKDELDKAKEPFRRVKTA